MSSGLSRVFAVPAARQASLVALGVLGIGALAGAIRLLPFALAPGGGALAPLALSALAAALEVALFVAPAAGLALAAARLDARGELGALASLGVSPLRLVLGAAPLLAIAGVLAALASAAWGVRAASPGRHVAELAFRARAECRAEARDAPAFRDVPLLGASWVCFPGEGGAYLVGALPPAGSAAEPVVFSAGALAPSPDLRVLVLEEARLLRPASPVSPAFTLRAGTLTFRGLPPLAPASNLRPPSRALLFGATTALLAAAAALAALRARLRGPARALGLGVSGPAAALLVFSHLERGPAPLVVYLAVPAAGLAALALALALAGRRRR